MANSTLSASLGFSYTDGDGEARSAAVIVSAPYQALVEGTIDVPDALGTPTVLTVPFGTVAKASGVWVKNNTANGVNPGQALTLKINGGATIIDVPPGGEVFYAAPSLPAANAFASLTLTTNAIQAGAGSVAFRVVGDSV